MAGQEMDQFKQIISIAGYGVEAFGVLIIIVGCSAATILFIKRWYIVSHDTAYEEYRRTVGRSIILGLEFLIAGDVIRTVIVSHTLESVAVLALIVVMRAFLSFSMALEIEGRLPWHKA
jgi:uncharacterized membrane protein